MAPNGVEKPCGDNRRHTLLAGDVAYSAPRPRMQGNMLSYERHILGYQHMIIDPSQGYLLVKAEA